MAHLADWHAIPYHHLPVTAATKPEQEQQILDLEREAFISLCGEQRTLDRMQHMLMNNKPLRN